MRRKSKRSKASYRKAGLKASRTRKRKKRKNPTRHRPVVYKFKSGKRKGLRRSPSYRLGPKRINRKKSRSRKRRNPKRFSVRRYQKQFFGKNRMMKAVSLLVGMGGAGMLKGLASNMLPEGVGKDWFNRLYGVASIILGATLNMQGRKAMVKNAGTGMVVFGLYDVLTQNIPQLGNFLPTIGAPSFQFGQGAEEAVEGYSSYGRSTMGASIGDGGVEVVGANITSGQAPEIVGGDIDLADALDMSA